MRSVFYHCTIAKNALAYSEKVTLVKRFRIFFTFFSLEVWDLNGATKTIFLSFFSKKSRISWSSAQLGLMLYSGNRTHSIKTFSIKGLFVKFSILTWVNSSSLLGATWKVASAQPTAFPPASLLGATWKVTSILPTPWPPGRYAARCTGTIQGKEGGIQVLAGLAPSSQTVGSNIRVIHEQAKRSSWMTEVNIAKLGKWEKAG